jgi:hypothetical protein
MPLDVLFYSCIIGFIECFKKTRIHWWSNWWCLKLYYYSTGIVRCSTIFPWRLWIIKFWLPIPNTERLVPFCSLSSKAMVHCFASSHFYFRFVIKTFEKIENRDRKFRWSIVTKIECTKLWGVLHHVLIVIGKWKQVSGDFLPKETNSYHHHKTV